jgi:hypothetical protein
MLTRSILIVALLARVASADPETLSLPWQLQPVTTSNVVRVDSALAAFNDPNGNLDISGTTALSARYQLTERWAPIIRLGVAGNNAPGAALDGSSLGNPIAGATYTRTIGNRRLSLLAATTLPIGTGGGNDPDPHSAKTNIASITARPADAAMFEVNYLTEIVGADIAYVNRGFTVQAEAMLHQSIRVRGDDSAAGTDALRTRAALGAHVGTTLGSRVSLGADLLYQRWLSHPTERDLMGARVPIADADLSSLTIAAGVRVHVRAGNASLRPGLSYTRGLGASDRGPMMITNRTNAVTFDLPVLF